jgi:uncharacterized repeat protein (TIGR01451 family)
MRGRRRYAWSSLLLAAYAVCAGGCLSESPAYFPYLLPPGDIAQTHAKPPGSGPYVNFDPYACRIEVRPLDASHPVGGNHVLIATVYDASGAARRGRRVEWMLEGAGHIVEVDESGHGEGRGYKVDTRYAVSYTAYREHLQTRGNSDPTDDFTIRPGQTWCVISSPVEGDTHITAYAPEIYNWDKNKVTVTTHWINAGWTIPPPAANRTGTPHNLTTNVYRFTDHQPAANYRVRYTILDGPPAAFMPGQQRVAEAVTDLQGNATVTLVQTQPATGINRISIEIIRPPDPATPTGPGIIIGRGETYKEWVGSALAINKTGPSLVAVGQVFTYTLAISNTGKVAAEDLTVRDAAPDGLTFMSAQPAVTAREGNDLIWTLGGALQPGRSSTIQVTYRAERPGTVTNVASVVASDGTRTESSATTQVTTPGLNAAITGPDTGMIGVPVTLNITLANSGSGPATNVVLRAELDPGLEHQTGANPIQSEVGTINAGESRSISLPLTPRQQGVHNVRVTATADGNLTASAQHAITVAVPKLELQLTGPSVVYVGGATDPSWTVTVSNTGDTPINNVVVRYQLAAELQFVRADQNGQFAGNGQVVWNLGTLAARENRNLQITARPAQLSPRAVNTATATGDPGLSQQEQTPVEIRGVPALRLEALNQNDGIVEVGKATSYVISVTNQGTLSASGIVITATLPQQMRFRSGVGPQNSQPRADGNRVIFPEVNGLLPNQNLRYQIDVDALQADQVVLNVEMTSAILTKPVVKQIPTNIIAPGGAPGGGAAAPAPQAPAVSPPMQ